MIVQWIALAAAAAAPAAECISVPQLISAARFRDYPAKPAHGPWRAPDVRHGNAHLFRTRLREDSRGEADFAGHYKVVWIGCGAGTVCPAIVDKASGQVSFVPAFREIGWIMSDFEGAKDIERLTYRRDSRLLILFGMRNEEERTGGVTFYDWRGGKPHLLRFVPAAQLCQESAA